jgi:hypothetical protein
MMQDVILDPCAIMTREEHPSVGVKGMESFEPFPIGGCLAIPDNLDSIGTRTNK